MPIVPIDKIPSKEEIKDTPIDHLMKVYKVCLDMETICKREGGIGLSATQIGIPWKLFVVRHCPNSTNEYFLYYLNCDYIPLVDVNQKHMQSIEGCLSLPGRKFLVERYPKIKVEGKRLMVGDKPYLEDVNMVLDDQKDIYLIVLQHEIDHNYRILISDIGEEMDIINVKQKTS